MSRRVVERLKERMYRHALQKTGKLPSGTEQRRMEKTAKEVAERVEKRKTRG
jgi:hypothetical protein